ncbi:NAD(P)H-hydrate dehydratase [Candidatus Woesearchaeota archaeon]|nr:NAD(P)H-hydrate dehydratase [Candidatus Woesearchaeota archaeon]
MRGKVNAVKVSGRVLKAGDIVLKKRSSKSHKGDNGKVLLVGGSVEYVGAIVLAGMAAYRSGVDLAVVAAPEKIAFAVNFWPDFITAKFKGGFFRESHVKKIVRMSGEFDVLLVGNGLGLRAETKSFAKKVVAGSGCIKVVDADAIKSIRLQDAENSIITPHRAEFGILLKNSGIRAGRLNLQQMIAAARRIIGSNVILLKARSGSVTGIIFSKDKIAYNTAGNAGMTVAGSGDVLAGLCAGLAAQGNSLFMSACAAAYVNGLSGDLLYREYGYGFTATDLADKVAFVLKRWA